MSQVTDVMEHLYSHLDDSADTFDIPVVVRVAAEFVVRERKAVLSYVAKKHGIVIPEEVIDGGGT